MKDRSKQFTDKEIIQGCCNNDRVFQEILYRKYFYTMMSMCHARVRDDDKAMHIVNDGFLKVFKNIASYSFKGSFEGWIRRIVYHALSDYFKKENKYLSHIFLEEKDDSVRSNSESRLFYDDLLELVNQLPFATAEVFKLYAIEGYNHREIGDKMGISDGTSKWHLSEARKKLKALIYKYDIYTGHAI